MLRACLVQPAASTMQREREGGRRGLWCRCISLRLPSGDPRSLSTSRTPCQPPRCQTAQVGNTRACACVCRPWYVVQGTRGARKSAAVSLLGGVLPELRARVHCMLQSAGLRSLLLLLLLLPCVVLSPARLLTSAQDFAVESTVWIHALHRVRCCAVLCRGLYLAF